MSDTQISKQKFSTIEKSIMALVGVSLLGLGSLFFYNRESKRDIARQEYLSQQTQLEELKSELLAQYEQRKELLFTWAQSVKEKKNPTLAADLAINEVIKQFEMKTLATEKDLERFDFVQNQISELFSRYIQALGYKDPHLAELQKMEEKINKTRAKYHEIAFAMVTNAGTNGLTEPLPLLFPAEKLLEKIKKEQAEKKQ